jgi:hypothetical protein
MNYITLIIGGYKPIYGQGAGEHCGLPWQHVRFPVFSGRPRNP